MGHDPCPLCLSTNYGVGKERRISSFLKLAEGDEFHVPGGDDDEESLSLCPDCDNLMESATYTSNSISQLQIKLKSEIEAIRSIILASQPNFGESGSELNAKISKIRKHFVETSVNDDKVSELELEPDQIKREDDEGDKLDNDENFDLSFLLEPEAGDEMEAEDSESNKTEISDEDSSSESEGNCPQPKRRRVDDNSSGSSKIGEEMPKVAKVSVNSAPKNSPAIAMKANSKVLDKAIKILTRKRENGAEVKIFFCPICNREFVRRARLVIHLLKAHENEDKPFSCSKCDKKYSQKLNLERHLELHRFDKRKPMVCEQCEARFEDQETLELHISSTHVKLVACPICSKTFKGSQSLLRHQRLHTGEKPFKCDQCSDSFIDGQTRKLHIEKVHQSEEKHFCDYCAKTFVTSKGLRVHLKEFHSEAGGTKIVCEEPGCGATFKYKETLQGHQIKVHGRDPIICDECGSHFINQRKLKAHKKLAHEGKEEKVKNFKCDICGDSFGQAYYLKIHNTLVHSTERPFVCSFCGNAFKLQSQLKSHEKRMHSKNYTPSQKFPCTHCDKKFPFKNLMEGHVRQVHTGERPFVCNFVDCGAKFATRHPLTLHLRKAHGIIGKLKSDRAPRTKREPSLREPSPEEN